MVSIELRWFSCKNLKSSCLETILLWLHECVDKSDVAYVQVKSVLLWAVNLEIVEKE